MRIALLAVFLLGCADGHPSWSTDLHVRHDDERGVTCWVAERFTGVAVFCLPDSELVKGGAR